MSSDRGRGRPPHDDILTPAEWRVVEAVRHGMGNADIAARQGVSPDAVKYHLAHALSTLGLSTRAVGAVGQIARSVSDIAAARRWYEEVLGLKHLYSFGDLAFFDLDGTRLFLSEGDGASDSILYFRVPDVRTASVALEARGVQFTHAPHMIHRHEDGTEEWMAFFGDNEGRPLAIMAQVKGTA